MYGRVLLNDLDNLTVKRILYALGTSTCPQSQILFGLLYDQTFSRYGTLYNSSLITMCDGPKRTKSWQKKSYFIFHNSLNNIGIDPAQKYTRIEGGGDLVYTFRRDEEIKILLPYGPMLT